MKQILLLISIFWIFPAITSAHTTVTSTNPGQGEVVTEELQEIKIEFAGEIESQSTLNLSNEAGEIQFESITVSDREMKGTVSTALENGNYSLNWKAASTDGHVISGEMTFSVNRQSSEDEKEVQEEVNNSTASEKKEDQENESTNEHIQTDTSNDRSLFQYVSVIILTIILAVGIWILFKKKR